MQDYVESIERVYAMVGGQDAERGLGILLPLVLLLLPALAVYAASGLRRRHERLGCGLGLGLGYFFSPIRHLVFVLCRVVTFWMGLEGIFPALGWVWGGAGAGAVAHGHAHGAGKKKKGKKRVRTRAEQVEMLNGTARASFYFFLL